MSIPFPFGMEVGCFARIHFYLACNPGPTPPILQMTEHSAITDISIDQGILRIQKLSDPGGFLDDQDSAFYAFSEESGVVKWAVDNLSCRDAMVNKDWYMCVSTHSECIEVTDDRMSRHLGYRCGCSSGFEGNPYIEDGCTGKFEEFLIVIAMFLDSYLLSLSHDMTCNLQILTSACSLINTFAMASAGIALEAFRAQIVRMEQSLTLLQESVKPPALF